MKIGIITIPPKGNYGGIMQAYALQYILSAKGNDVELIMPNNVVNFKLNPLIAPLVYAKRLYRKYIKGERDLLIRYENRIQYEIDTIAQNMCHFIDTNMRQYKCGSYADICSNDFDAIVVGSDQVWRVKYLENILSAYLDFAKNWKIKRIAYAASFGIDNMSEYSQAEIEECAKLAKLFDAISVREDSAKELCKNYFNVDAQHLLDPTMLLESSHYNEISDSVDRQSNIVFSYFLDQSKDKKKIENYIAERLALRPYQVLPNLLFTPGRKELENYLLPSPERWLAAFRDAEFVVTDSFHGAVFSIIFNKPFVVVMNKERGAARFTSLLKMFGLEDRLIHSSDDIKEHHFDDIDWSRVDSIKKEWQDKSFNFIKKNLH